MKLFPRKSSVTTQDKECRTQQPNSHLLALNNHKNKKDAFPYSNSVQWAFGFPSKWPCFHWFPNPVPQESTLSTEPDILAPPSTQQADCWRQSFREKKDRHAHTCSTQVICTSFSRIGPRQALVGHTFYLFTWGHQLWSQCLKTAESAEGS